MKKIKVLTALLAVAALLCGCAAPAEYTDINISRGFGLEDTANKLGSWFNTALGDYFGGLFDPYEYSRRARKDNIVPFDEMAYSRPDIEEFTDHISELEDALDEGKLKLDEIIKQLDVIYDDYYNFSTMSALADVRNCLNTGDGYYREEYLWCEEQSAVVSDLMDEMLYACGGSKYARRLENNYFWDGFAQEYSDISDSMYSDTLVELLQREAELVARYRDICANATLYYGGEEMNADEAFRHALEKEERENYSDESVNEYNTVLFGYYEKYNPIIGELFLELVKVRNSIAEEAGYDSYEQMAYEYEYERDYTPEQSEMFISLIERYMVPLYAEMNAVTDPYSLSFDCLDTYELESCLLHVTEEFGGVMEEARCFMEEYELYDITVSDSKVDMSFQIYFDNFEAPFLFVCAQGNSRDVLDAVHEFGHYTEIFNNFNAWETIDLSECFSQGLEFLALDLLEENLGSDELAVLSTFQALDAVETFVQQSVLAEFEHMVYAMDDEKLTVENLNTVYLELCRRFGLAEAEMEEYCAACWIDIPHFFEVPFYVISYPVSLCVALQFGSLEAEKSGAGRDKYMEMLDHSSGYLLETVEEYKLQNPLEENAIKAAAELIRGLYTDK